MEIRNKIPIRKLTSQISAVATIIFMFGILTFVTHPNITQSRNGSNHLKLLEVQHQRNEAIKNETTPARGERTGPGNVKQVTSNQMEKKTMDLNRKLLKLGHAGFWKAVSDLAGGDELYPAELDVNIVLRRMTTSKIVRVTGSPGGTSFKWVVVLEGGQRAVFKPQLVAPEHDVKEHCNMGHEQPGYEVAAFHLMRLFGWRNVPFAAGRKVDILNEILPVADDKVRENIKVYDNGTVCLVHKCHYCDGLQEFCPPNNTMPGALMFWLNYPIHYQFGTKTDPYHLFHPLSPNYTFHGYGVNDHRHCDYVRSRPLYSDPRYFLDLVDMSIMGHVLSHEDEKHVYIGASRGDPIMTVHIDHGLAFCDKSHTSPTENVLAVIKQCCCVRQKTISGLSSALTNLKADFMSVSSRDALYPLLSTLQLDEVISRISDVFKMLSQCQKLVPDSLLFDRVH